MEEDFDIGAYRCGRDEENNDPFWNRANEIEEPVFVMDYDGRNGVWLGRTDKPTRFVVRVHHSGSRERILLPRNASVTYDNTDNEVYFSIHYGRPREPGMPRPQLACKNVIAVSHQRTMARFMYAQERKQRAFAVECIRNTRDKALEDNQLTAASLCDMAYANMKNRPSQLLPPSLRLIAASTCPLDQPSPEAAVVERSDVVSERLLHMFGTSTALAKHACLDVELGILFVTQPVHEDVSMVITKYVTLMDFCKRRRVIINFPCGYVVNVRRGEATQREGEKRGVFPRHVQVRQIVLWHAPSPVLVSVANAVGGLVRKRDLPPFDLAEVHAKRQQWLDAAVGEPHDVSWVPSAVMDTCKQVYTAIAFSKSSVLRIADVDPQTASHLGSYLQPQAQQMRRRLEWLGAVRIDLAHICGNDAVAVYEYDDETAWIVRGNVPLESSNLADEMGYERVFLDHYGTEIVQSVQKRIKLSNEKRYAALLADCVLEAKAMNMGGADFVVCLHKLALAATRNERESEIHKKHLRAHMQEAKERAEERFEHEGTSWSRLMWKAETTAMQRVYNSVVELLENYHNDQLKPVLEQHVHQARRMQEHARTVENQFAHQIATDDSLVPEERVRQVVGIRHQEMEPGRAVSYVVDLVDQSGELPTQHRPTIIGSMTDMEQRGAMIDTIRDLAVAAGLLTAEQNQRLGEAGRIVSEVDVALLELDPTVGIETRDLLRILSGGLVPVTRYVTAADLILVEAVYRVMSSSSSSSSSARHLLCVKSAVRDTDLYFDAQGKQVDTDDVDLANTFVLLKTLDCEDTMAYYNLPLRMV